MSGVLLMAALRPLAQLVTDKHDEGQSFHEMSRQAQRAGRSISHSQLASYAKDEVAKMPSREQMEAIAAALQLSFEEVAGAAFMQYHGYLPQSLGDNRGNAVSAAVPYDLSPDEEEELARLVRAWVAARRASDG